MVRKTISIYFDFQLIYLILLKENPLTLNQFLDQLPSSVIRNGKVIDIRNDLSHLLTKTKPNEDAKMKRADILVIQTPTLIDLKMRYIS